MRLNRVEGGGKIKRSATKTHLRVRLKRRLEEFKKNPTAENKKSLESARDQYSKSLKVKSISRKPVKKAKKVEKKPAKKKIKLKKKGSGATTTW
jgi:hypothetical protein